MEEHDSYKIEAVGSNPARPTSEIKATPQYIEKAELTEQQRNILCLIAEGKTNKEIAGILFIELPTIKAHMRNIRYALNAETTSHALALAIHKGLVKLE